MYYRPKVFFPKKTYSMFGEDLVIEKFFRNKKNGFYVDVGCYHPIVGSNTFLLFKKGWTGVNIDLNKISIELFDKARKKDKNFQVAITNKDKKIKFYFRKKINMLNTISKKFAKDHFKKGFSSLFTRFKKINSILNKTSFKNKKIDFLNLDIEGNELNALRSLNFKKYNPKLICVEIHNINTSGRKDKNYFKSSPIYKFLVKKGYKHVWKNEFSFIFKANKRFFKHTN